MEVVHWYRVFIKITKIVSEIASNIYDSNYRYIDIVLKPEFIEVLKLECSSGTCVLYVCLILRIRF